VPLPDRDEPIPASNGRADEGLESEPTFQLSFLDRVGVAHHLNHRPDDFTQHMHELVQFEIRLSSTLQNVNAKV
jgi:hypothetical protein